MHALVQRHRRLWLMVIALIMSVLLTVASLVLIVIAIEVTRLVTAYAAIDRAAYEARRYAVAAMFDRIHCTDGDQCDSSHKLSQSQREKLEDIARLTTIYDIALRALSTTLTPTHVVVCSTRPGYFYDSHKVQCLPRDDAGGPRDKVMIHIEYNYPLGSSVGIDLGSVVLQSTYQGTVECVGSIRIQGLPPTILPRLTPTHPIGPIR